MEEKIVDMLKVPRDRIAVLIGKEGKTKNEIERRFTVKLEINSETGEVNLIRNIENDALKGIQAREVIKAIAGGIAPQKAYKLENPQYYTGQVNLAEAVGDSDKELSRVKSRLIGTEGKVRAYLSKLTDTEIIINNNLVTILGEIEDVNAAKEAVSKIIEGTPIPNVIKFVEKYKRQKMRR
ncbi:MAG: RNA-processing protein [DPANN group archaeon]|nr:RNA-processing protein [DPANN group archaeon]